MATQFQKQVKKHFTESDYADKIVCKQDGSVEVKHSYFYRHGNTAEKWADRVKSNLEKAGFKVEVDSRDDFRQWPADSYFVAIVTPMES